MKKLIFTFFTICFLFILNTANAQYCGNSGPAVCIPTGGPAGGGFENPDTTPCIIQGVAYSHAIEFTMFAFFDYLGHQTVDSIEFDVPGGGIDNIPCGVCWATNHANNRFKANEDGCLLMAGTTHDSAGQYKLQLNLKAWINGNPNSLAVPASLVDQAGIKLYLRVKTLTGTCAPTDTSSGAATLIHSLSCPNTAVNDVSSDISSLLVVPNPINTVAELLFNAEKNGVYTLKISDLTGNVVSSKEIEVKMGENKSNIEKGNLQSGVYFLSLSNGKKSVTRRFSVIE